MPVKKSRGVVVFGTLGARTCVTLLVRADALGSVRMCASVCCNGVWMCGKIVSLLAADGAARECEEA
eukprot:1552691-Alexandrium_andersonii.AAC.1